MATVLPLPTAQEEPDRGVVKAELGAALEDLVLPRDVAQAARQAPPRPFGDLIVVDQPSEFIYGGRGRSDFEFHTPRSRFISLMTCEDQVYSIRIAPQLQKLSLPAAADLAQTLSRQIDGLGWRMEEEPQDEPGPLVERLKARFQDKGRRRYVFNRRSRGNDSVYLTLERVEPGLLGWLLHRGGAYLVNVVFRNAALERDLLARSWKRNEPARLER